MGKDKGRPSACVRTVTCLVQGQQLAEQLKCESFQIKLSVISCRTISRLFLIRERHLFVRIKRALDIKMATNLDVFSSETRIIVGLTFRIPEPKS